MHKPRSVAAAASFVVVSVLLALVGVAAPIAAAGPSSTYDSIPSPTAPNYASLGFQATSTRELGDDVWLGSGGRTLQGVTIGASTWARQADVPTYTNPGAWSDPTGWDYPFTVKVYAVSGPVTAPVVGPLLAQATATQHIPWRHPDTTGCGANRWSPISDSDTTSCFSGQFVPLTFDLSAGAVALPSRVAVTLSFDTQTYGAIPLGANGPYNSFNVALPAAAPTKGVDVSAGTLLWDSTFGGRPAGLAFDSGWTGYVPAIEVVTTGGTESTTVVTAADAHGWSFFDDNGAGGTAGSYVSGPATPPLGHGSARLVLSTAAQGQALLRVPDSGGTRLDSINELVYSTYRTSVDAGGNLAIALQLAFDFDLTDASDGFQGRLVHEPYHTNGGAVTQGAWQTWDALSGKWWLTRPTSVTPAATCVQATPCSLAQLLVAYPNAGVHKDPASGIVLKAGSGWATFDGNLDALRVGIDGVTTQYDFEDTPQCTTDCYVSPSGNDLNGGTSYADAKKTIQAAINTVLSGGIVHVNDGTYAESPNITKSLTLVSEHGRDATTIQLQAGPTYTGSMTVAGADVTVDGFTIVGRDGTSSALAASNIWIVAGVHDVSITDNRIRVGQIASSSNGDDGIGILTTYLPTDHVHQLTVTGNIFEPLNATGSRAFFVNPGTDGFTFSGNTITGSFTRTATTQARLGLVEGNTVTGSGTSATLGAWGYPNAAEFGHTTFRANTISGVSAGFRVTQASGVTIEHNVVTGVTDGVAVDGVGCCGPVPGVNGATVVIRDNSFTGITGKRVTNSYPSAVNASANWWGTTAVAAGDITGLVDYTPVLTDGGDTSGSAGFQESVDHLKVHTLGAQLGTEGRIQEGIDTTVANGLVDVAPGLYSETATGRTTTVPGPTYQFGLYVGTDRDGVTVRGVDAADAPITSSTGTLARITTNATNNFGSSGTFVVGSDATFRGLEFGTNSPSSNKTFEVIGDGFSLLDSYVNDTLGSVYLNDWLYDTGTQTSSIATFTIEGNRFAADNQITIASGTGYGHPESGRLITDNTFVSAPTGLFISFRGAAGPGGVPWYTHPVGGAVITGNTFGPADINIRATDTYAEDQLDWAQIRDGNTFTRLVWVEEGSTGDLRSFAYSSSGYAFTNARQLGGRIDWRTTTTRPAGVQIAQAGDTVHVHSGTYPEQAIVDKADITVEGYGTSVPLVDDGGAATGNGILVTGDGVTLDNLAVQGYEVGVRLGGGADSLLDGVSVLDVQSTGNSADGLFASAIAGLSDLTIDGGVYSDNANTGVTVPGGRGIVIWDGPKSNISITGVTANANGLVGIDINDGNVTSLTISGNTVVGNADSGIGVLGAQGPGANLVAGNAVTDNGRFGIEIKNADGNGSSSGAGSVVVRDNTVSRTTGATDTRDYAGIAVFRRSPSALNPAQPDGVVVRANLVSGYDVGGTGDGFGIVVEGTGHRVTQNIVTGNDVGIQAQAGQVSNTQGTPGFDRGDAASYGATVLGNSISGNIIDFRAVGLSDAADASGNWWGTTVEATVASQIAGSVDYTPYLHTGTDTNGGFGFQGDFSSLDVVRGGAQVGSAPRIQEAIDMVTGSTVYVHEGMYDADVDAHVVDLQLLGAQSSVAVAGRAFGGPTEATIRGLVTIRAEDVRFDGFSVTTATHTGSLTGILVTTDGDGAVVTNSIVSDITSTSPSTNSTNAQAIYLEHGPDDVSVTGNRIETVSSHGSAKGIYVGDSTASDPSTGILIHGNVITGVTSVRGAYGIQHNNGVTGGGHAQLTISGNTISVLNGGWVHGIGIEGNAPDLSVHHNRVSALTAAGIDNVAVFFQADASWAQAEVHNNDLAVGPGAFGVALHPSLVIPGSIDAECNWFGSASGPGALAAGTGSLVGPSVDYDPWLTTSSLDGACDSVVETVAPTSALGFAEGTPATNGGTFVGTDITITHDATIGSLVDGGDGTWSWSLAANALANDGPASGTITVTATTALGATATTSFSYTITNVAPGGTFVAPAEVAVGDSFDIEFDPTIDPAAGDTFSYTFTCGAASPVSGSSDSTTCAAPTSGQVGSLIHVTGSITDDDGATSVVYEDDVLVVPALTLSPSSHAFGQVQVGETSSPVTFTLTNHSDVDYDVDEVGFFVTATNHFRIVDGPTDDCSGAILPAHSSCTFEVVFEPQSTGAKSTTLGIELDGTQAPLPKPASLLTGTGIAAVATVGPDALDFGSRDISAGPSAAQTITIENTGDAGSTLTILAITRSGSPAFAESYGALVPLGYGDTFEVEVTFDPTTVGDHDGAIVIKTSAGDFSVTLEGTGTATPMANLAVTPATHNFGDVTVDHAKTKQFTVTNNGTAGLTGLAVELTGDDLTIVEDESTCDEFSALAAGESCTVKVRYQPDEVGDDTGSLSATADGGLSDTSSLLGSGVPGQPIVTVTPDQHEFDPVVVGGTPDVQDFTVRNTGDAVLTGMDIEIAGAPAFTVVPSDENDCETETTSLAPDATCVVRIQFAPGAGGDKSATLRVLSGNAGNGTVNVPLSGVALAPELSITPSSYDFGDVTVGHTKKKVFTVRNTGTAPLTGLDVDVTGDDLSLDLGDSTCDDTTGLDAGEDCEVRVRYQPDEVGADTGSLSATADGGLSDTSDIEGYGQKAKGVVSVDPDEWDFGSIDVGTTASKVFSIENTGDATLTDLTFLITGSFAIESDTCDDTLAEDAECTVTVEFGPGTPGAKSGTLKIQSDDSANPTVNVPLAGTATPPPSDVTVTPNPWDFGHVVYGGVKTKLFTVTNHGGTPVTITDITKTGSSTFTVPAPDNECAGETLGEDESCSFKVRFQAPSNTAGVKNATLHLQGTGYTEVLVPLTATAEPFKAKVDAFVTDRTDKASNYVGKGVFCASACVRQQVAEVVRRGATVTYRVRIRNAGNGVDDIRVRLYQTGSKASIQRIQVLRNGNQDVTSRVSNGSYVARDVNPGAEIYFWVRVTVKTAAVPGRVNYVIISGQSTRTPSVKDYVRMRTTVR